MQQIARAYFVSFSPQTCAPFMSGPSLRGEYMRDADLEIMKQANNLTWKEATGDFSPIGLAFHINIYTLYLPC